MIIMNPSPPVEIGSCAGAAGIEDDGKVNLSGRWRWAKSWNYQDGDDVEDVDDDGDDIDGDDIDGDDNHNCNGSHKDDIKFNLF